MLISDATRMKSGRGRNLKNLIDQEPKEQAPGTVSQGCTFPLLQECTKMHEVAQYNMEM